MKNHTDLHCKKWTSENTKTQRVLLPRPIVFPVSDLEGEEQEEGHHEAEQTHGLGQGESQDGVGEQLLLEGGVPGVADDQGAEDGADSGAGSSNANGGSASADELGSAVNVLAGSAGLDGAAVHGLRSKQKKGDK